MVIDFCRGFGCRWYPTICDCAEKPVVGVVYTQTQLSTSASRRRPPIGGYHSREAALITRPCRELVSDTRSMLVMLLPLVVVGDSKVDGSGCSAVPRTCFSLKVGVGGVTAVSGESKREMESCSEESSSGDKKSPSWGQAK
ncbi:hypothetical protein KQX54_007874 [Cotesia glomerata]|uniref:Uncharacterized protein n=1 Tax=Cotesia glomerata TaxID=32391 RepID=A0AAV7J5B4_COTGL|nr:hypothetical protein KQX54_007874 [Cotesia glomerata]